MLECWKCPFTHTYFMVFISGSYTNTLSSSTSCRIQSCSLREIVIDANTFNHVCSHFSHNFWNLYGYFIQCQYEDSMSYCMIVYEAPPVVSTIKFGMVYRFATFNSISFQHILFGVCFETHT